MTDKEFQQILKLSKGKDFEHVSKTYTSVGHVLNLAWKQKRHTITLRTSFSDGIKYLNSLRK